MRRSFLLFLLLALVVFLVSCSAGPVYLPALPTEQLSTLIAQTVQARLSTSPLPMEISPNLPTPTPTLEENTPRPVSTTPDPTIVPPLPTDVPRSSPTLTVTPRPTRTPSPTPTQDFNSSAIQIQQPGPLSKVVSPVTVSAYVRPGANGRVQIELIGEDGRLLVRKVDGFDPAAKRVFVSEELEFEVAAVAEAGRLQIKTYDKYGRLMEQESVDLILLSMGETDLNPSGPLTVATIIQEPSPNRLIQGGTLLVSGLTRLSSDQPLLVELIASNGEIKGYRQVEAPRSTPGSYSPFTVEVPYKVTTPTWVRLTFQASSAGRVPGVVYATSLEVLLSP